MSSEYFKAIFSESVAVKTAFMDHPHFSRLPEVCELLASRLKAGGKILLFGNGGSAADAQHIAAELVNKLVVYRPAIAAISLCTDTSVITSIANDLDFSEIYARQIEALGRPGDVAFAISTSGHSPNILKGIEAARNRQMNTVGLLGRTGGPAAENVDLSIIVPGESSQRIQEIHITIGHAICQWLEDQFR